MVEAGADLKAVHEGETPLDAFLSNYQTRGGRILTKLSSYLGDKVRIETRRRGKMIILSSEACCFV
jgi:hypothetical protein